MKKFLTMAAVTLLAVAMMAIAACGGAKGTLSSYVSAVKDGDFTEAAEYVVGGSIASSYIPSWNLDDEVVEYMYSQTAGSFKYSVEETSTNEEETATTVTISYSFYSLVSVGAKYTASKLLGNDVTKSDIKDWIKGMDKVEGTTTVALVTNDDGDWLLTAASAGALNTLILL
ncbi:MAG: hypothetical protein LUI60_02855 [Clostridia bacterium]|nr:hypothetical protein [Clostridia bacterium]